MAVARRRIRPLLATAIAALLGVAAFGCSSGSSDSSSGDGAMPTHLVGLYEASTTGDLEWISFSEPNVYALVHNSTIDTDAKTMAPLLSAQDEGLVSNAGSSLVTLQTTFMQCTISSKKKV